jgi:hypothetical protein
MNLQEALKILVIYNKWRRGSDDVELPGPKEIGEAIDVAINILKGLK